MKSYERPTRTNPRSARALFFGLLILAAAPASRYVLALEITQSATFSTANQSLFNTGTATTCCAPMEITLFKWGPDAIPNPVIPLPRLPIGQVPIAIPNAVYPGGSASITAVGTTSGEIKVVNTLTLDGGGVNATVPYNITLDVPTYSQFAKQNPQDNGTFNVLVKDVKYTNNGSMTSTSPLLQDVLNLNFSGQAQVAATGTANFLGKSWSGAFNARLPNQGNFNMDVELFSFNRADDGTPNGQVRILSFLKIPDLVKKLIEPKKAIAKVVEDPSKLTDPNTGKPSNTPPKDPKETPKTKASKFSFSTKFQPDIFAAKFHYPYITLDTSQPGGQVTDVLSQRGKSEFAALEINMVSLFNLFVPNIPLGVKQELKTPVGGGELSGQFFSAKLRPALNLTQSEAIQPLPEKLSVNFDLGAPKMVRVISGTTAITDYQNVQSTADLIRLSDGKPLGGLTAGQKLEFQEKLAGEELLSLTPVYLAKPTLSTDFGLSLGLTLPVELAPVKVKLKLLGLEADKTFNLGAETFNLGELELQNPRLYKNTFALEGFQNFRGGALILSTKAYEWTGAHNDDMFYVPPSTQPPSPGNWMTGGIGATDLLDGQNVVIPGGANIVVKASQTGNIGSLTIAGNSLLVVNPSATAPNITLNVSSNVKLDSRAGLLIKNNATVSMNNPAGARIDGGGGAVQLDGATANLNTAGDLNLLAGTIGGAGNVNVAANLTGGSQSRLFAVGGNLAVSAAGRIGGVGEDRMRLMAGDASVLSLRAASLDSARVESGNGKVELASNMSLANLIVDKGGKLDVVGSKTVTLQSGDLESNGALTVTAGSTLKLDTNAEVKLLGGGTTELQSGTLDGTIGKSLFIGEQQRIRLTGTNPKLNASATAVTNTGLIQSEAGTTGAMLVAKDAADGFVNKSVIRGLGATALTLSSGTFRNEGVFDAGETVVTVDSGQTTTSWAPGSISMLADSSLENLSDDGAKFTLTGGVYQLNTITSKMDLNLKNAPARTQFVNKADIRLLGTGNGAENLTINGTKLSEMTSFENIKDAGGLTIGIGGKFITPNLINHSAIMLVGSNGTKTEIGNVNNETDGKIVAVPSSGPSHAVLRLNGNGGDTAINKGTILVDQAGVAGSIKLTLAGDVPGTTKFRNDGLVVVRGAGSELAFEADGDGNLLLNPIHSGQNGGEASFAGGTWIADSATIALPFAALVLDADVTFIGDDSRVTFGGGDFENGISRIGAAGKLRLDSREMSFGGPLNNTGEIHLTNSAVLKVPTNGGEAGLVNSNLIEGGGLVNQPAEFDGSRPGDAAAVIDSPVLNNGTIAASGGQLTLKKDVKNLGFIVARAPNISNPDEIISGGAIGLEGAYLNGGLTPNNEIIPSGFVFVESNAALWGWGRVTAATLINDGSIVANDFNYIERNPGALPPARDLTIDVNANLINRGEMVATAGRTLTLQSNFSTLNNVGTPADPGTNTPAVPGYLKVQYVQAFSGLPVKPYNGHMVIDRTTVVGGVLEVRGNRFDRNGNVLPLAEWASVDGSSALLSNVVIDVDQGVLRSQVDQQTFTIIPAADSEAQVWGSQIRAEQGGTMLLTGIGPALQKYTLYGTDVIASGMGQVGNSSRVVLNNVDLTAGKLATEGAGRIDLQGSARFTNVSNEAALNVPAGGTLELSQVFYNANGGVVAVGNNATLALDSAADVVGGVIQVNPGGRLQIKDSARVLGAAVDNRGMVNLAAGQFLTVINSNDPGVPNPTDRVQNSGSLTITSTILDIRDTTFNGVDWLESRGKLGQTGGSTLIQTGGSLDANFDLEGGVLKGDGYISGKVAQTGGTFEPGLSPGTFNVGSYELTGGLLHLEAKSLDPSMFDHVVAHDGTVVLDPGGIVQLDLTGADPDVFNHEEIRFDVFDASVLIDGKQALNNGTRFSLVNPGPYHFKLFDELTGTIVLAIPEPASAMFLTLVLAVAVCVRGRHR